MTDSSDLSRGSGVMTSSVICPAEGEQKEREGGRPQLGDLRSHLTCVLCAGYFIDATTIVECLHTFCRSCILRHLKSSSYCPVCAATIHRTKASSSLRADRILQTLVYKMVPDLFRGEMQQRRDFYEDKPYADPELPGWAKGDVTSYVPHVFTADEHLHLRLALFDADRCDEDSQQQQGTTSGSEDVPPVRYLRCQAGTPLSVLQKFIRSKFQLPPSVQVQLIGGRRVLPDDVTLMDLGYMGFLAQNAHTHLSFRLVQRRKRPAAEAGPNETPSVKSARLETASPATAAVDSTPPRLPEAVIDNPTTPDAPSSETPDTSSTCPGSPRPKISTTTAARPASDDESTALAPAETSSPSLVAQPAQLHVSLSCVPVRNSPALSTTLVKLPSVIAPPVASGCVSPSLVLSVTVRAETMFDPDDEEATSPQVVQDIIASLDAEEEGRPVGGVVAAVDRLVKAGKRTICALNVVENAVRRKPDEDARKQILEDANEESAEQDGVKAVNGEANVVNGERHGESREAGKVMSERTGVSHGVNCKKHEVQHRKRVGTDQDTSRFSAANTTPELSPTAVASLETSAPSLDAREKGDVDKDSIKSNGAASQAQSNGTARGQSAGDVNMDQSRVGDGHPRISTSNGVVSEATKHTNGADKGQCNNLRASEVLIEKRWNSSVHPAAHCARRSETTPAAATVYNASTVDPSVQTSSLSKQVERVSNSKHMPCYARSLDAKDKSKTSPAVKDYLIVSSAKSSETSGGCAHEKAIHILKEKATSSPNPFKLNVPSPVLKTAATSCRTTLKIPKAQYTINNITKPTIAQLPKLQHAPVLAATLQKSHPFAVHDAGYYQNTAPKRYHQEPFVPTKHAEIQQDSSSLITPLDLSNPSKKTVAADSTSMLSKSPAPSPKPKLPKLDTGKSQNIHSIVDSLANREHISLTAIPTKTPRQRKKPSNHVKDSKLTGAPMKLSSHHVSTTDAARKAPSLNVKTTAGVPRNYSYHPQSPTTMSSPMSPHRPLPMSLPMPESASCYLPPGGMCSPPLHVDTSFASRLGYDMAMRNLLTLSHMAMAQGGMVRPHMFPMQPMFPPRPKSHDFHPFLDPSLLRQQSEARMGAASKKASPTAGTTAPQVQTPTSHTSASIQHMEDLSRTMGKRADKERHSVTVTSIPFKG